MTDLFPMGLAWVVMMGLGYYLRGRGAFEGTFGAKTLNGFLWALPVLFLSNAWWGLLYYAVAAIATKYAQQMGHGSYFDLGRVDDGDDETVKPFVELFFTVDSKAYDWFGFAVTGVLGFVPLAIVIAFATGNWWFLAIPVAGLMKPPAYEIGWRIDEATSHKENPIGLGEIFFGLLGSAVIAAFLYLL